MLRLVTHTAILSLSLLFTYYSSAAVVDYSREREVYQLAQQALAESDIPQFSLLRKQLQGYPLVGYLDYEQLRSEFNHLPTSKIDSFLIEYEDRYISRKLKASWLAYLGKNQYWSLFKQYYDDSLASDSNRCYLLRAELSLETEQQTTLHAASKLWLQAYSMPNARDPLFNAVKQAGMLSPAMAFNRFQLAYAAKNDGIARIMLPQLNTQDKKTAQHLLSPERDKAFWLAELARPLPSLSLDSAVIKRVLERLSAIDNDAIAQLMSHYQLSQLNSDDRLAVKRLNAWYMAKTSAATATAWLDLQAENELTALVEQQLRFSLQSKNWPQYLSYYDKADKSLQQLSEWRYWKAIADIKSGDEKSSKQAVKILNQLAGERNYYGFLAARYFKQDVFIEDENYQHNRAISSHVFDKLSPAIELYYLGEERQANNEWYYNSRSLSKKQHHEAGILANQIGWHARAIHSFAAAKQFDAIAERFPLAFNYTFTVNAKKVGVDTGWLMSMARQESGFSPLAQSHKGALGVLQLMPATAKKVARKNHLSYSRSRLFEADYNIQLASLYLQEMLETFDYNYILATAAYNAGPTRVREWLSLRPIDDDWAHWVATIPYKETRNYVQNILAYSRIYQAKTPTEDLKLTLFQQDKSNEL